MSKVLIALEVPGIAERFDLFVPTFLTIEALVPLLIRGLREQFPDRYAPSGHEVLCMTEHGGVLNVRNTLSDYAVGNGDHIYML